MASTRTGITEEDLVYLMVLVDLEKHSKPDRRHLMKGPVGGYDALREKLLKTPGVDLVPLTLRKVS